jgi:phage terminase Nu1 subunit (DNA packaging protein)
MTTGELTRILGVSPPTIKNWIALGLPFEREGYTYNFDILKVKIWLMERQEDSKFASFYKILADKI